MDRRFRFIWALVVAIAVLNGWFFYVRYSFRREREEVLKKDLRMMREAIDNYTIDKQAAPQSLQDLVARQYLKEIPKDPITRKENWVQHFGDSVLSTEKTTTRLDDIHSASGQLSRNGTPYNTW
jgi:general secretion pathway protein G